MRNDRILFEYLDDHRSIDQPGNKDFVLALAEALHRCGTPAHRLEAVIRAVCEALDIDVQCYATPTSLFISSHRGTEMIRVEPGTENLEHLVAVDRVATAVASGEMGVRAGRARLEAIPATPSRYGEGWTTLSFGLVSATVGVLFGLSFAEVVTALALGLGIGLLARRSSQSEGLARLFEATAACGAAMAASLLAVVVPMEPRVVTLTAVIILLPGFTLTVALAELATGHLVAGTARAARAAMTFLQLGLGAAIGWRLLDLLPVLPPPGHFAAPPQLEFAALMVGASAIAVLLRVRPRDLPVVLLASIFAFYGAKLGALLLGSGLGALVGGLSVGLFSNLQARLREVPAAVAATPGILLLVPGSMGFQGVEAFLQQHTLVGVNAAFETCMVGASLVGGLLLAHALLPPRRAPAAFRSQQRPL